MVLQNSTACMLYKESIVIIRGTSKTTLEIIKLC